MRLTLHDGSKDKNKVGAAAVVNKVVQYFLLDSQMFSGSKGYWTSLWAYKDFAVFSESLSCLQSLHILIIHIFFKNCTFNQGKIVNFGTLHVNGDLCQGTTPWHTKDRSYAQDLPARASLTNSRGRYMAEIFPIRRKKKYFKSINQSINHIIRHPPPRIL